MENEQTTDTANESEMPGVSRRDFGRLEDGRAVTLYTLRGTGGFSVDITDYGGIVTSVRLPEAGGAAADVVLGFDSLAPYLAGHPFFGAIVGRYGNRIAKGRFALEGESYQLATNNGANHLHGGIRGFDKVLWEAGVPDTASSPTLRLRYRSAAGEEGYPGNLDVVVVYSVTDSNTLRIDYEAVTDAPTIVNLTNHTYFNLSGPTGGTILDHVLMLNAGHFLPVDSTLIPTGEIRSVEGTPFDFRQPTAVGARIDQEDTQLSYGGGYDHCWVLDKPAVGALSLAARLTHPASGRFVEVFTTEPGVQFYTGNFLDGSLRGKGGVTYPYRGGLCLETQHFPDSPNRPEFPSVVVRPGETYRSTTVWKLGVKPKN